MGHLRLANAARKQLKLGKLYLIPTGDPPHKKLPEGSPDRFSRLEMVRLAAENMPKTEVLDWEVRREGPSYTADTVEALLREDPNGTLWLICSTDMFLTLSEWHRGEWLLKTVHVAVDERKAGERVLLEKKAAEYRDEYGTVCRILNLEPLEISSTEIRNAFQAGKGSEYVPEALYADILRRRLYDIRPQPDALWKLAVPWYKEKRLKHVQGCREEAVRLAIRWGADCLDAENAAILHDITKKMPYEEQLQLCTSCGIIPPNFSENYSSILHAFSGAAAAWMYFGVSEEVREAIRWHTTGKPDMSLLEKIIWLADYIEPTRSFQGLDELRQLAYQDLDQAVQSAMQANLLHLKDRGIMPHPATVEALAYLTRSKTK